MVDPRGRGNLVDEGDASTVELRVATLDELAAIERLQKASMRELGGAYYDAAVIGSAVRFVSVPDARLVADGTYFVAYLGDTLVGCGGWSFRRKTFAGPGESDDAGEALVPGRDAARIRAMFVDPQHAGTGIGSRILDRCEQAARDAGFDRAELGATLSGEAFYRRHGYVERERVVSELADGAPFAVVMMTKPLR